MAKTNRRTKYDMPKPNWLSTSATVMGLSASLLFGISSVHADATTAPTTDQTTLDAVSSTPSTTPSVSAEEANTQTQVDQKNQSDKNSNSETSVPETTPENPTPSIDTEASEDPSEAFFEPTAPAEGSKTPEVETTEIAPEIASIQPTDAKVESPTTTDDPKITEPTEQTKPSDPTEPTAETPEDPTNEKEPVTDSETPTTEPTTPAPDTTVNAPSDFSFEKNEDGYYIVTGYTGDAQKEANGGTAPADGYSTAITIPDKYEDKEVVAIADNAFNNDGSASDNLNIVPALTSVTIGKNIQWIGKNAFANNDLTSVDIPDIVWSIGDGAFENNKLTHVNLNNVSQINKAAFANNQLTQLVIPEKTTNIAEDAFKNNHLTSLTLGSHVETIGTSAFADNQITGTLTLPDTLTDLGDYAFQNNQLSKIIFNDILTRINTGVFQNNQLTGTLVLPDSALSIGNNSFEGNQLTGLQLGNKVQTIGTSAFENNQITGTFTTPTSVTTSIGVAAFKNNQLTGIKLGALDSLGESAFENNKITHLNLNPNIGTIGDHAFSGQQATLDVSVDASVTHGLDVRQAIAEKLGLPTSKLANLSFTIGDQTLNYTDWADTLDIPGAAQRQDIILHLTFASDYTDTGSYGVSDLALHLVPKMITADVAIPSNLSDAPWIDGGYKVVKNVTAQLGDTDVPVLVPDIPGYTKDTLQIKATVTEDAITANAGEYVIYTPADAPDKGPVTPNQPDTGGDTDPDTPNTPDTPNQPSDGGNTGQPTQPDQPNTSDNGNTPDTGNPIKPDPGTESKPQIPTTDNTGANTDHSDSENPGIEQPAPNPFPYPGTSDSNWSNSTTNQSQSTTSNQSTTNSNLATPMNEVESTTDTSLATSATTTNLENDGMNIANPSTNATQPQAKTLPQTGEQRSPLQWLGLLLVGFASWLGFGKKNTRKSHEA